MPSQVVQERRRLKRIQILVAILFSLVTIITSFMTDMVYVPISADKVLDVTIVTFVFAVMIGGYWMAIPLALVWTFSSWWNVDPMYVKWPLWQIVFGRVVFAIGLVWCYETARKIHYMSPYNVYRGMLGGLVIKSVVALPFEIIARGAITGIVLRLEIFILEAALCSVFMALLIKHLREIHILNGVRKKEKRVIEDGN